MSRDLNSSLVLELEEEAETINELPGTWWGIVQGSGERGNFWPLNRLLTAAGEGELGGEFVTAEESTTYT